MTQIADIKIKISGGGDVQNVLGQVRAGTLSARDAQLALKTAILEAGRSAKDGSQITQWAAKEGMKDLRLMIEAERNLAATKRAAASEAAAQARAAAAAQRVIEKQLRENEQRAQKFSDAMRGAVSKSIEIVGALNRLSGVPAFSDLNKGAAGVEELLARARLAMGKTKEEWEKMGAKKILFDVASASGKPIEEVIADFTKVQNETSRGAELLANGGKLYKEQSRFAQVTGGGIAGTATTLAKFSEQYDLNAEEQSRVPGALIMQQMQGSLEADTAGKFVKVASQHRALTGKAGMGGLMELLALGNTIKDLQGFTGMSGAASTATYLQAMIGDLRKGKAAKEVSKMVGHDVFDKEGHVDIVQMATDLAAAKGKMGERKFGERLSKAFPDVRGRSAIEKIIQSVEKYGPGSEKSIAALASPDAGAGQDMISKGASDLLDTENVRKERQRTAELNKASETFKPVQEQLGGYRETAGNWLAEHPRSAAALETGIPQGAAVVAAGYAAKKAAPRALPWLARMLGGIGGLGAGALLLQGDNANLKPEDDAQRAQRLEKGIAETRGQLSMHAGGGGFAGWFFRNIGGHGAQSKESLEQNLAKMVKELADLKTKAAQPQINLTVQVNVPGAEARVLPDARTSAQLAQTGPVKATGPGRK